MIEQFFFSKLGQVTRDIFSDPIADIMRIFQHELLQLLKPWSALLKSELRKVFFFFPKKQQDPPSLRYGATFFPLADAP